MHVKNWWVPDPLNSKAKRLYPWVAFETFHMKGKKGEFSVLLFNFLENTISETQKGILSSSIPFAKLNVFYLYNMLESDLWVHLGWTYCNRRQPAHCL
jgi:hypothetical protein